MSLLLEEIEKQSKLLVPQEKAELAKKLIAALDGEAEPDVEELWIAEAQNRLDAYRRGELEARPRDEVIARIRDRLR
ncbi:MAG: addiction module protein [Acidobacteriota bacterium]